MLFRIGRTAAVCPLCEACISDEHAVIHLPNDQGLDAALNNKFGNAQVKEHLDITNSLRFLLLPVFSTMRCYRLMP